MAASMGCSYYRPGESGATDDLRRWGSQISLPMTTCVEDAHCRTDQVAADDVPGPVRAGGIRVLADHGARLGPGVPGPGDRDRCLSHPGKNPAAARRKASEPGLCAADRGGDDPPAGAGRLPGVRGRTP